MIDPYILDTTLRIVLVFVSSAIFVTYPFWVRAILEGDYI